MAQSPKSESADLGNEFQALDHGMWPLSTHAAVISCLQINARARPPPMGLAAVFRQAQQAPPNTALLEEGRVDADSCKAAVAAAVRSVLDQEPESLAKAASRAFCSPISIATGAASTPPTRCPSTPESATCSSSPELLEPSPLVLFEDAQSKDALILQTSPRTSVGMTQQRQQQSKVECKGEVAAMKAFLSSPEAVCGLSLDQQVFLRGKLAAAQTYEEDNAGRAITRGRLVYQDTILPAVPLGGLRLLA